MLLNTIAVVSGLFWIFGAIYLTYEWIKKGERMDGLLAGMGLLWLTFIVTLIYIWAKG